MAYKSKYEELMDNALNKITNREQFSYDFNADPMFQMYKDQYTKLGNEAAQNAAANVSALTGGYGNSYATTAAAQANQQYLTKLNDIIPSLNEQAFKKYQLEGDQLKDIYSVLSDADSRDYSKYRDDVSDEQWQKTFDENNRQWQENFNYGKERDKVSDEQWQKNYDQALKQFEESVRQYNQNFDYGKSRDAVADEQWQKNYDQALNQYNESVRQYEQNYAYNLARDAVQDAQWRESFDYNKSRDAASDAQWQAQFDENNRRYNQEWNEQLRATAEAEALARLKAQQSGSSGSSGNSGGSKKSGDTETESVTKYMTATDKKNWDDSVNQLAGLYKNSRSDVGDAALDQTIFNLIKSGKIPNSEEAVVELKKAVLNKAR